MAESTGRIVSGESFDPEQVPSAGVVSKVRRNVASKSADRIKNRLSKSPKRRAGTPEPERRIYTDDSEKDISDENVQKSGDSSREVGDEGRGKQNFGIRRFFNRSKGNRDLGRSRSLERSVPKDPESEDDFEEIRRMHKSKEIEEEMKEAEKLITDSKPKIEELKGFVPKDMPPLIVAPKDMKKRKRHKSLPLQESQSEEEKPKTPLTKTRTRITKRKPSTSEEEDLARSRRGSSNARSEDEMSELRNRRLGIRKGLWKEKDTSESEREPEKKIKMEVVKESAKKEDKEVAETKSWFFKSWFPKKPEKEKKPEAKETQGKEKSSKDEEKPKEKLKDSWLVTQTFREWRDHVNEHRHYYESFMQLKNRCVTDLIILLIFCGFGGFVFRFTEGAFESFYKCGVKRVKRDFIDTLWKSSQYMLEEDWKSQARRKLMDFEDQLHSAHEAGMTTYSGMKSWSFLNAVVYCLSVVTTIGYGHISPSTTTGRAITIIYAIFGIPMFLILLADFGKLFTRGIKFVWAFVRRLYYTGSCRRVRKTAPVQEMMKGVQIMYDFAKSRRLTTAGLQQDHLRPPEANMQGIPETPGTPNWSAYEIDDEFNLPISVAISILLTYIFFGATLYWMWEDWTFFESFYFVFISMSTIGFGDFVPQHPMYMMLSIVYLIFGLALTSMCINVVQEKLSDTFRQASVKLGTTIGLTVVEDGRMCPQEGLDIKQINQQIS